MRMTRLTLPLLALLPLAACDGGSALEVGPGLSAGTGMLLGPALGAMKGDICIAGSATKPEDLSVAANGEAGQSAAALLARQKRPKEDHAWLLVLDGTAPGNDHIVEIRGNGDWFFVAPDATGAVPGLPDYLQAVTCAPAPKARLVVVRTGAKRAGRSYTMAVAD
ncbi:hypothetical protein [Niveispirillum irakense]|uniref:hypothetical protein n=1 Tax=Niveispirillum irakense TaxID=34011 RepID=UPI00041D6022|nr:hypothetical protein [Niveispirillum irakense]